MEIAGIYIERLEYGTEKSGADSVVLGNEQESVNRLTDIVLAAQDGSKLKSDV
jgi:hypothetical protein